MTTRHDLMNHARIAIHQGQLATARSILCALLHEEPNYAEGWFMLHNLVETSAQRQECLHRALAADPKYVQTCRPINAGAEPIIPVCVSPVQPLAAVAPATPATPIVPLGLRTTQSKRRSRLWTVLVSAAILLFTCLLIIGGLSLLGKKVALPSVSAEERPTGAFKALTGSVTRPNVSISSHNREEEPGVLISEVERTSGVDVTHATESRKSLCPRSTAVMCCMNATMAHGQPPMGLS